MRCLLLLPVAVATIACTTSMAEVPPTPARKPGPAPARTAPPRPPPSKPAPAPLPPAPPPAPVPRYERDAVQRMHMHENFDLLRAIERLLIRGRLDDAKRFATAISELPDSPAHGPWAAQVVLVRDRAASLARATTVEQACHLEAKLAAACAGCHDEASVGALFDSHPPAPPDGATVDARMARHRWAADRLWEGIVGDADGAWKAGLEVLAAPPMDFSALDRPKERAKQGRALQRLAAQARKRRYASVDARATAYGAMLTTCAACHVGPTEK